MWSAGRDLNPRLYGFAGRSLGPLGHRRRDSQRTRGWLTGGLSEVSCGRGHRHVGGLVPLLDSREAILSDAYPDRSFEDIRWNAQVVC